MLSSSPVVLGVDVGFSRVGWALIRVGWRDDGDLPENRLVDLGLVRTEPGDSGKLKSDDNMARTREIFARLANACDRAQTRAIAYEAQSWGMGNSTTFLKLGLAFGALASLAEVRGLPLVCRSPQAIKKALTGLRNASKEDVAAALGTIPGFEDLSRLLDQAKVPPSLREHPVDAVAAAFACLDDEVVRAVRSGARRPA